MESNKQIELTRKLEANSENRLTALGRVEVSRRMEQKKRKKNTANSEVTEWGWDMDRGRRRYGWLNDDGGK